MKIAIMYRTTSGPWGGGNSFLCSLKDAWQMMGVEVVGHLSGDVDGVLFNSSYLGAVGRRRNLTPEIAERTVRTGFIRWWPAALRLSRWRRRGRRPPFVHRLDGVFRLYGRRAGDPADKAQIGINQHLDWTIYQSEYGRVSFASEGLDTTRSTIVWNGVDTARFRPSPQVPPRKPFKILSVAWSSNINKGAPYAVAAGNIPGIEVTFIGRWPPSLDLGNVRLIPPLNHDELATHLREHHALLNMARNETCSNVILEGLASGLPVIYHPSGGSPEIVGDSGVSGEPDLAQAIETVQDRYDELREIVLARRQALSIARAARQYLDVFEALELVQL